LAITEIATVTITLRRKPEFKLKGRRHT